MNSRIRDLREDADFTQAQIASYLNMSQTGYSKYETGEMIFQRLFGRHWRIFIKSVLII